MIIFPILLAVFTWLLIVWLCNQHKYLNIFEQIALWFCTALSLFVLELFIWGMIFNTLSLMGPIISFVVCICLLIYKNNKYQWFIKEIIHHIKGDFHNVKEQFHWLKNWQKYVVVWIAVYVVFKLIMIFSININMPTFDEDAVAGWDVKTKIFASNQSLVLDKASPEYFGTDYGRYPFAGIIDTYFLLPYGEFVNWLSNIISPLTYLLGFLLLFGIFLRKSDIFWASLSGYIFVSLPFVFVHGIGSYRNFPAGMLLFIFIFYLIDQLFHLEKEYGNNRQILLPILSIWFISSIIRNEWVVLTGITFFTIIILYHIFKKNRLQELRYQLRPLIPIILGYIFNKIIFTFYPTWTILNTWGTQINTSLLNSFFTNINQPGVFVAPFQQMFYHSDYTLLFLLLIIAIFIFLYSYKKLKQMRIFFIVMMILFGIFLFILYSNLALWLITHFAFTRYPVSMVLFLIYFIWYTWYLHYEHKEI